MIVERDIGFEEIIVATQHGYLFGLTKGKFKIYSSAYLGRFVEGYIYSQR